MKKIMSSDDTCTPGAQNIHSSKTSGINELLHVTKSSTTGGSLNINNKFV